MMHSTWWLRIAGGVLALIVSASLAHAQRVQFPSGPGANNSGMVPVPSFGNQPAGSTYPANPYPSTAPPGGIATPSTSIVPGLGTTSGSPATGLPPVVPGAAAPPPGYGATLGPPAIDPYSSTPAAGAMGGYGGTYGAGGYNPAGVGTPGAGTGTTTPPWRQPMGSPYGMAPPPNAGSSAWPYGGAGTTYPTYGAAPGQPDSLFPNGLFAPSNGPMPIRLLDDLRIRETWTAASDGLDIGMNDIELGIDFQFPEFLGTTQPLIISPQFALSLWDGPQGDPTRELPASVYGALVEAIWNSDPAYAWGASLSGSVGVFSDFNAVTTDSIRLQTLSYAWVRLTPQLMLKAGVNYIDRVELSLLPAVGLLWEPNPQTRLDIFFPKPKLARQFTMLGTTEVWLYTAAEYGNGSWTVEHYSGSSEQVDINDIRVGVGVDWFAQSGSRGMFEVGWVTARDVVYRHHPGESFSPKDTFFLRAGFAF
ncbi:MAG: hypothetical protein ACKO38_18020 [Planctomycetota bacterium]